MEYAVSSFKQTFPEIMNFFFIIILNAVIIALNIIELILASAGESPVLPYINIRCQIKRYLCKTVLISLRCKSTRSVCMRRLAEYRKEPAGRQLS